MLTALTSAVALVVSLAVTPIVRLVAERMGLLDQPDAERKIHQQPVPRLGGVAIAGSCPRRGRDALVDDGSAA